MSWTAATADYMPSSNQRINRSPSLETISDSWRTTLLSWTRISSKPKAQQLTSKLRMMPWLRWPTRWSSCSKTATRRPLWRKMNEVTWPSELLTSRMRSFYWSINTIRKQKLLSQQPKSCYKRSWSRFNSVFRQWPLRTLLSKATKEIYSKLKDRQIVPQTLLSRLLKTGLKLQSNHHRAKISKLTIRRAPSHQLSLVNQLSSKVLPMDNSSRNRALRWIRRRTRQQPGKISSLQRLLQIWTLKTWAKEQAKVQLFLDRDMLIRERSWWSAITTWVILRMPWQMWQMRMKYINASSKSSPRSSNNSNSRLLSISSNLNQMQLSLSSCSWIPHRDSSREAHFIMDRQLISYTPRVTSTNSIKATKSFTIKSSHRRCRLRLLLLVLLPML